MDSDGYLFMVSYKKVVFLGDVDADDVVYVRDAVRRIYRYLSKRNEQLDGTTQYNVLSNIYSTTRNSSLSNIFYLYTFLVYMLGNTIYIVGTRVEKPWYLNDVGMEYLNDYVFLRLSLLGDGLDCVVKFVAVDESNNVSTKVSEYSIFVLDDDEDIVIPVAYAVMNNIYDWLNTNLYSVYSSIDDVMAYTECFLRIDRSILVSGLRSI